MYPVLIRKGINVIILFGNVIKWLNNRFILHLNALFMLSNIRKLPKYLEVIPRMTTFALDN